MHGFVRSSIGNKKIWVAVGVNKGQDELHIEIRDNGCGMSAQQLMNIRGGQIRHSGKIGLQNIEERIHVLFGEAYGLKVDSIIKKGTTVIIRIPFIMGGEDWNRR